MKYEVGTKLTPPEKTILKKHGFIRVNVILVSWLLTLNKFTITFTALTHFIPLVFLYPLKTSENLQLSDVFWRYRVTSSMKWVKQNLHLQISTGICLLAYKEPHNLIYFNPFVHSPHITTTVSSKMHLVKLETKLGRLAKCFIDLLSIFLPWRHCKKAWRKLWS